MQNMHLLLRTETQCQDNNELLQFQYITSLQLQDFQKSESSLEIKFIYGK